MATHPAAPSGTSLREPLRAPVFRRMWLGSLLTNFGLLIQGVGAAWAMTLLSRDPAMIALVQTATMAPMMVFALLAGAVADTYDRRKVVMVAMTLSLIGGSTLTAAAWLEWLSPWLLLALTFVIGTGLALFSPAWQASVGEQVPPRALPSAISLNVISFNIARSFGPALGGVIVAAFGAVAAFLVNALSVIPMLLIFATWRRPLEPARFPPERLQRAVTSGARYVFHSPAARTVVIRTVISGTVGCALSALMPLIARELLGGGAEIFGILLGAFGVGAVIGALVVPGLIKRLGNEGTVRACSLGMALGTSIIAISRSLPLTLAALVLAGAAWMIVITVYNVNIQTMAPRWVVGRMLASFQTAIAAGVAVGSWLWGEFAAAQGVEAALLGSATLVAASAFLGAWKRLARPSDGGLEEGRALEDPTVELAITDRSGPIMVEIVYRIPRHRARSFYLVMQDIQVVRQRNGGYGWAIARDIAEPELWIERFHCPTWLDYLRQRTRTTAAEVTLHDAVREFHQGPEPPQVRRMLERPFGSVRWRDEVRDDEVDAVRTTSI